MRFSVPRARAIVSGMVAAVAACASLAAHAGDGIDHRVNRNTGGIFAAQDVVPIALAAFSGGCALWEGTQTPIGKTCWESAESIGISGLSTEALQYLTGRQGPSETSDPGRWFTGARARFRACTWR